MLSVSMLLAAADAGQDRNTEQSEVPDGGFAPAGTTMAVH
jgi:hypothetical protein